MLNVTKERNFLRRSLLLQEIREMEEADTLFEGGLQGAALKVQDGMPLRLTEEGKACVDEVLSLLGKAYEDLGRPWNEGCATPDGINELFNLSSQQA